MKLLMDYVNPRNINGKCFENTVEKFIVKNLSVPVYDYKEIERCYVKFPCLIRQVKYNIVGKNTKGRSDFAYYFNRNDFVRVECKYQDVPGSTIEKLPNLYSKIHAFKEKHVIVVFGGKITKIDNRYKLFENYYVENNKTICGYKKVTKLYKTFYDDNLIELVSHIKQIEKEY
jgi:hypothetical protein